MIETKDGETNHRFPACLLLTATINPTNTPGVARPSSADRENDYAQALEFYLKTGWPIVFVENSDTRSARLLSLAAGRDDFEYHTFSSLESWRGKGHGEKEIFDYALTHSELLNDSDWIVKVSGRYTIRNIDALTKAAIGSDADVLVNWGRNLSWADTCLMLFKKSFYINYFKPCAERWLDERNKLFIERIFARSVHRFVADGGRHDLLPQYPLYFGINGENGKAIAFPLFRSIKFRIYYRVKKWVFLQIV